MRRLAALLAFTPPLAGAASEAIGGVFQDAPATDAARPDGITDATVRAVRSGLTIGQNIHAKNYTAFDGAVRYWSNYALLTAGVIALAFLAYAAYLYVIDLGDGSGAKKAQGIVKAVVTGLVVMVASYVLVVTLITYFPAGGEAIDSSQMIYEGR